MRLNVGGGSLSFGRSPVPSAEPESTKVICPMDLCPACNDGVPRFAFSKSGYDFYRCPSCDFLFVHPFPSEEEIAGYYNQSYRSASPDFYPKARSRARRTLVKSLRFLRYVRGKSVLDIGCGGGFMVNAFSRLGAQASGLDIAAGSIAYARKHFPKCQFYCESFNDFRRRQLSFDFVFSTEVLEHLPGPGEFMATLEAVTKPGSYVYIAAPDAGHPAVPRDISQWGDVAPPEHLQFFNRRNLSILFGRHGFALQWAYQKATPAHSLIFHRET